MKLYEYNGAEFSEEDVIAAAEEKGLSTDEYIKKYNIKPIGSGEPGKKKPVAEKGAPATGKTQSTASKPATTSSVSKKVNPWETAEQAKKREATFGVGAIVKTPKKTEQSLGPGTEYNSQGYLVPKEKELSVWEKLKTAASELFQDDETDTNGKLIYDDQNR